MKLEVGELVLYHGRLAEVLNISGPYGERTISITDEGGIQHSYNILSWQQLAPLQPKGGCILDALQRAAAPELTPADQLQRMAEVWLAAPEVGDVFVVEGGYLLELTEIWDNGVIIATQHPYSCSYPLRETARTSFDHDQGLRRWLKTSWKPVYRAAAYSTLRDELKDHPLLYKRPSE